MRQNSNHRSSQICLAVKLNAVVVMCQGTVYIDVTVLIAVELKCSVKAKSWMSFSVAGVGVRHDFIATKAYQNKAIFPPVHCPAGNQNNVAFYSRNKGAYCVVLVPSSGEVSTN